jgi:sugar phosphate isomerase/epimerase
MNNPYASVYKEIKAIAGMGFDYIDLTIEAPGAAAESTDWRKVRQAVSDAGLGLVCHTAPYLPINNPSALVRQAAVDELRRSIDAAAILEAQVCTMHFMGWPGYLADKDGYEYYRQLLTVLINHGKQSGVAVAMENSPKNSHQLKTFREIFQRLPDLKLLYDVGHGNIDTPKSMTGEYLFALADRLVHVHMSDNDGKGDDHLPFGAAKRGTLKLKKELQALRSFNYDGTITLEIFGHRRWLQASAEWVRELWAELG